MLTDSAVRSAKRGERPRKLSDGGGLYLLVSPRGGRDWRYNYRYAGKEKTLALGVYPDVSLAKARERHLEARRLLADGIDPSAGRKTASKTFEEVAVLRKIRIRRQQDGIRGADRSEWTSIAPRRILRGGVAKMASGRRRPEDPESQAPGPYAVARDCSAGPML